MSNPLTTDEQTKLLFKQFMGVSTTEQDRGFESESFNFVPNIFSKDIKIEDIPSSPNIKCNVLDASGTWLDSVSNYSTNSVGESINSSTNKTFNEMFPDSKLKFYKKLSLVPVTSGAYGKVWGSFYDASGSGIVNKDSVLKHAIPFKYDDIDGGYLPVLYRNYNTGSPYQNYPENLNSNPLYWLMDSGSGYVLMYGDTVTLQGNNIEDILDVATNVQDVLKAPRISCFVYSGKLGITNIDVSGQQQVGDISGSIEGINTIKRMILPDGSTNVLDLCGNDAIRTQYQYVRKNIFIGYPGQPVIDNSNVNHDFDPSYNAITYELDVSGNTILRGKLDVSGNVDVSGNTILMGTLNVSGNVDVSGNTLLLGNLDVSGNTLLLGNLDVSGNVDVSGNTILLGNLGVTGKSTLTDVSATNLSLTGTLNVLGNSTLSDAFATNITVNRELYVNNTNILTKPSNTIVSDIRPLVPTQPIFWYNVAFTVGYAQNVSAYFTFTTQTDDPNGKNQRIHFLAGVETSQINDDHLPYIKVLSNNFNDSRNCLAYIDIAKTSNLGLTPFSTHLLLGFSVVDMLENCELRMYKNAQGLQEPNLGSDWIIGEDGRPQEPGSPIFTRISNFNYFSPGPFWQSLLHLDLEANNIGSLTAFSTLYETFLGNVDICGNLGVGGIDTCGNIVAGNLTVTGNTYLLQNLTVSGTTSLQNTTIQGDITVSGLVKSEGNSTFVTYKHYDNANFQTTYSATPLTLNPNWCTIASMDSYHNVKGSTLFQIIDKTSGVDQNMTFLIGVNESNYDSFSVNILENNWSNLSSQSLIRNLRIVKTKTTASWTTEYFYLQLDRVSHSTNVPITDVDIRLYLNTQNAGSGGYVTPWILDSTRPPNTPSPGSTTYPLSINLQSFAGTGSLCNTVTNAYNVSLNGAKFGYNIDMSDKDITNVNEMTGNSKSIDFNSVNNMKLSSNNKIELLGTDINIISGGNEYIFASSALDFNGKNIIDINNITGVTGQILNIYGSDVKIASSTNDVLIKTNTPGQSIIFDSGVTVGSSAGGNLVYNTITYKNEELELAANTLSTRYIKASKKLYTNDTRINIDVSGSNFYFKPGYLDVDQNKISNVHSLYTSNILQNATSNTDQILIGNSSLPKPKFVKFYNKISLYTAPTLSQALDELNGTTAIPNNYLIGYNDTDICGGLIYNCGVGSGYMKKLITTTSSGYFSTNFFRTLGSGNIYDRTEIIHYSASSSQPFYRVGFNYTDNLILNPGTEGWAPGSSTYTGTPTLNPGNNFGMKNLQLPDDQLIRVLSFTFDGYNTEYKLNAASMGVGNKVYFEIVFGFGTNRVFQTGPWTSEGQLNFIKCYEINTNDEPILVNGGTTNFIKRYDLSLNTQYNHLTNPIDNNHMPVQNKAIPTFTTGSGGFKYNDLQPYIFIRAMNGSTNLPWTFSALGVSAPSWIITNEKKILSSGSVPNSDLHHTCPFGAQFQFEHHIPAG